MIVETAGINSDFLSSRSDHIRDEEWRSRKGLKKRSVAIDPGFAKSVEGFTKEMSNGKRDRLSLRNNGKWTSL